MVDSDFTSGKAPAFQFYPKDFLADENVRVMSLQERGAYITLLSLCWIEGTLPSDVERLARLCAVPTTTFRRLWPALEPCFRQDSDRNGRLIHPRLERERQKQRQFNRRQSDNGRKGGRPKKPNENPNETQNNPGLSSGLTQTEPKKSSAFAVCSLQSSDSGQESGLGKPRAIQSAGVGVGTFPRDHLLCRQPCIRVCLSEKQHSILREKHGGSDADLDAFYADVRSRLDPLVPIGDRPWAFWDAQFAARFGSVAVNPKTAGNLAAAHRFIEKGSQR